MFKKNHIYYQFRKGEVTALHVETNKTLVKGCLALAHPRSLMGDFFAVQECLISISKELIPKSIFSLAPVAVVHLLETSDGGYTNVEIRAFKEAVLGAGARAVYFVDSPVLLKPFQIQSRDFKVLPNV
ncbi:hypothetical protein [Vibrio parahaemolyticus]|uniref:hypothetical protein n=1 Tax=Vibrio parahaemolyticus TaxID=670 RepID=UPI001E44C747|nr:hypothetical protein [Vibrio parahaemolyticus]